MSNTPFIIFAVLGVVLVIFTLVSILRGYRSSTWPSASGTVILSVVERKVEVDADNTGTSTNYYPRINYGYLVSGQEYIGNKRVFAGTEKYPSQRKAQNIIDAYPTGLTVTVYYNPANPHQAILEPGVQTKMVVFFIIGVGLLVFSGLKLLRVF
jgi:hypothetical protein